MTAAYISSPLWHILISVLKNKANGHYCITIHLFTARSTTPNVTCPDSKTVHVNSRDGTLYNLTSEVTVTEIAGYTTTLTVRNPTIHAMVDDIGSGQIVTVTANFTAGGPLVGTTSQCSYMVNIKGMT